MQGARRDTSGLQRGGPRPWRTIGRRQRGAPLQTPSNFNIYTPMVAQRVSVTVIVMSFSAAAAFNLGPATASLHPRAANALLQMQAGQLKGYFATSDVQLVARSEEDVTAFHEKERNRWRVVYDEDYVEAPQEYYPGDRVKIVSDIKVKEIENANGMQGTVVHFEFDDGYESCQTCSSSCPVTVLLD